MLGLKYLVCQCIYLFHHFKGNFVLISTRCCRWASFLLSSEVFLRKLPPPSLLVFKLCFFFDFSLPQLFQLLNNIWLSKTQYCDKVETFLSITVFTDVYMLCLFFFFLHTERNAQCPSSLRRLPLCYSIQNTPFVSHLHVVYILLLFPHAVFFLLPLVLCLCSSNADFFFVVVLCFQINSAFNAVVITRSHTCLNSLVMTWKHSPSAPRLSLSLLKVWPLARGKHGVEAHGLFLLLQWITSSFPHNREKIPYLVKK